MSNSTVRFAENSLLDILIPEASHLDIEEALRSSDHSHEVDESALITSVPQRTGNLDESLNIYVVLQTPYQDERQLKSYVSRLAITLEALAISSSPRTSTGDEAQLGPAGHQSRNLIWSGVVDVAEDPVIVVEESTEDDEARNVFIMWKLEAVLSRPRMRLQAPAVSFKLSASVGTPRFSKLSEVDDPYMPSGVPLPVNLLQSLQADPALKGIEPRLSALRLSRAMPPGRPAEFKSYALKAVSRRAFRAIPALGAKVRYNKPIDSSSRPLLIASLDIEVPSFVQYDVQLEAVDMQLPNGEVENLVKGQVVKLPMKCRSRDNIIFLYRLSPGAGFVDGASNGRTLAISIDATVLVSDICRPRIAMRWSTGVDFSTALNPSFGAPGQSMQRSNRPASLPGPSINPLNVNASVVARDVHVSHAEEVSPHRRTSSLGDIGITVTFTEVGKVYVGVPFQWEVFVVNRSTKPQKLAIIVIPKRRKGDGKKQVSRPSSSSSHGGKKNTVADAVIDENYLYTVQKTGAMEDAQLVCLTTDIRIGPLNPGSCYSTELKFLPLAKGVLAVEAVRIIDVSSTETIDVRGLPDIIAAERPPES